MCQTYTNALYPRYAKKWNFWKIFNEKKNWRKIFFAQNSLKAAVEITWKPALMMKYLYFFVRKLDELNQKTNQKWIETRKNSQKKKLGEKTPKIEQKFNGLKKIF